MELSEVRTLLSPPAVPLKSVAKVLGIGLSTAYQAVRDETFPFPVIRIGERIVIPTAPIRAALGVNLPEVV